MVTDTRVACPSTSVGMLSRCKWVSSVCSCAITGNIFQEYNTCFITACHYRKYFFAKFLYQLHDSVRYRKVCLRISYVIDRRVTVLVGRVVGVQSGRCIGGPVRTRRGHGQMAGSKCPKVAFRHNFGAARLGLWSSSGHDVHQRTGRTERGHW